MEISGIFTAAPAGGRCPVEMASFALLDQLRIPYHRVEHDPADTMEACAAISDALGIRICKNLFLCNRQKTDFYLLTMPEDKPFHTKDLSHQIGSARLMNDTGHRVRLVMDREVYEAEWFGCHPCKNDGSLRIKTADLLNVFLPHTGHEVTVVEL